MSKFDSLLEDPPEVEIRTIKEAMAWGDYWLAAYNELYERYRWECYARQGLADRVRQLIAERDSVVS